ncbi:MAG: STAS domain-containing protein [Lachnospiraceae bacterium]|nr:STAS domain-containing protein [Lachnospiraceae bacterium]
MNITEVRQEDVIELKVEGRVDTNTSGRLQEAILKALQKSNKIVINCAELEYVSSAGLRSLLLGHKTASSKGGSMTVINVNDAVNQVFTVTGFSRILKIG